MRNVQKALGRFSMIILGLAMMMLLANCSGDAVTPSVDQPITTSAAVTHAPGWPGEIATGDGEDQAIDQRLDLKWGVTEYVASNSAVIGVAGGDLQVSFQNYTYKLNFGTSTLTKDFGVGLQVSKGLNAFGENLSYVSFTPQNASVSKDFQFVLRNPYSNAVRYSLYYWSGTYGWVEPQFFSCDASQEWVNFKVNRFGTYALLVAPVPFVDNNAS